MMSSEPVHPQPPHRLPVVSRAEGPLATVETQEGPHWLDGEWSGQARPGRPSQGLLPSREALLRALRRRWALAVAVGLLLGTAAATAVGILRPAKYTAFALLQVASAEPKLLPGERAFSDPEMYRQTQVALVKSQPVILHALRQDEVRELPSIKNQSNPVDWLEKQLGVDFIKNTELLRIALSGENPEELAVLVNAVEKAYLRVVVNREKKQRLDQLAELERACDNAGEKIRDQREKLRKLAEVLKTNDSQALTLRQKIALEEYAGLKKELAGVQAELREARQFLAVQQARSREGAKVEVPGWLVEQALDELPEVRAQGVVILKLEQDLAHDKGVANGNGGGVLERREREIQAARTSLQELRQRLRPGLEEKLRARLQAEARGDLAKKQERVAILEGQREEVQREVTQQMQHADWIGEKSIDLEMKRGEIEQAEAMIKTLRTEKERLQVELQSTVERITEFHPAEVPQTKNLRVQVMMMVSAGLFFFAVGAFGVSFWECRAQRVDAQEDLVRTLGTRVVGTLPALQDRSGKALPKGKGDAYWRNLWKESIDGVRTVLLHEAGRESYRVLMVTSAGPREGKTTLVSHLAISVAATGRRTLLIDGDLRRPVLHRLLETEQGPGLSEVLLGLDPFEAIRLTSVPNLSLLPAGQVSRRVIHALGQDKFSPILEGLRGHYDFILIDSSPVLLVNDALLMGQHVDGVLLSIRPHTSQLPKVQAAYERLAAIHVRTVGMVYNGASHRPGRDDYHYLSRLED